MTFGFRLDLDVETRFFFLAAVEEEEVCAAPAGKPAPDAAGAALTRSAAPKMESKFFLLIVESS